MITGKVGGEGFIVLKEVGEIVVGGAVVVVIVVVTGSVVVSGFSPSESSHGKRLTCSFCPKPTSWAAI